MSHSREEAEVRFFTGKVEDIFSSPSFSFKILEDDETFQPRQVGAVTLASESVRGTFEIVDGDRLGIFEIDRDTGMISTTKPLDRERQSAFALKVAIAISGVKTFSECVVKVDVQDLNDNVPSFEKSEPKLISAETNSAVGQPIHRVLAEDPDDGDNGRVGFRLEDKTGYFSIDETSGKNKFLFGNSSTFHYIGS